MAIERVSTDLGRLHVERLGSGQPVVLWHSLFLDSRSWCGLAEELSGTRSVVVIDGPSHGRSEAVQRDFTFAECVNAAEQVLDALGLTEPVDWLGNAWGGHVGTQLAVHRPGRVRTLATIGTPAHALRPAERWVKAVPLVHLYRAAGPNPLILKPLSAALLGPESLSVATELSADVMRGFTEANRAAMFRAIRSMMLKRPDMSADMSGITVPTLLIAARDDSTGWRPDDARAVARTMANATVVDVAGSGHCTPLLIDRNAVLVALQKFWADST